MDEIQLNKNKILHLVLFSHDNNNIYNSMYNILSTYYNKFSNITTIFYLFSKNIQQPYELINNVLYIKGDESYVPGILDKTLLALSFFENEINNQFDYVIRSNISTIVNFDVLINLLAISNIEYGAGFLNNLNWQDPNSGVINTKYYGTIYGSGTSIILSKKYALLLVTNKDKLNKELIDDLAIGLFFRENITGFLPKSLPENSFCFVPDFQIDCEKLKKLVNKKDIAFYRNRNKNRSIDVEQMKLLIQYLQ